MIFDRFMLNISVERFVKFFEIYKIMNFAYLSIIKTKSF